MRRAFGGALGGARAPCYSKHVFYVFLLLVAAAGIAAYLIFFMAHVPGFKEERFGELAPLPDDLGKWKDAEGDLAERAAEQGLRREERLVFQEASSMFGKSYLLKQVRFRSLESNEIVRILPEEKIERKRIR